MEDTLALGIETSCDDTTAAVVQNGRDILSTVATSQDDLHERFGGVVPEIACRAHIESILPVIDEALDRADMTLADPDAVAVTNTPGLIGSLLIGLTAAKSLSWSADLPLVPVNHLDAHIYAVWLSDPVPELPAVSLVVSGGHTSLYYTEGPLSHSLLGHTIDDAAGEAYDKVANILGLGYPGGPVIEEAAREGDPNRMDFPRIWLDEGSLNFSFSGLKTAVLYRSLGQNATREDIENADFSREFVADVCASFQEAVVDVLVGKTEAAAEKHPARSIILGGGVAANGYLRERLETAARDRDLQFHAAPLHTCTDNAAMVAGLGCRLLEKGQTADLALEASP
jgi:N6-L-threonylcarbamoyladenine synthase